MSEFGVVDEGCEEYQGQDESCHSEKDVSSCERSFALNYEYVGGYHGACSEQAILNELAHHGPVIASIDVSDGGGKIARVMGMPVVWFGLVWFGH